MLTFTSVLTRLKTFCLITSQGRYLPSPVYCNNSSGQVHIRGVVLPSLSKDTGLSILGISPWLIDMKGGLHLLDHPPLFPQELPYQFHIQHIELCGPWLIFLFGVNRNASISVESIWGCIFYWLHQHIRSFFYFYKGVPCSCNKVFVEMDFYQKSGINQSDINKCAVLGDTSWTKGVFNIKWLHGLWLNLLQLLFFEYLLFLSYIFSNLM